MNASRRDVLKMAGMAIAGSALPTVAILNPNKVYAGVNSETLKVGLIGCGGRGSGAANQALKADKNVVLHAMGDIFKDKMDSSHANLSKIHGAKVKVDEDRKFLGFDAFQKVLDSGVDVVLLATPPHFRPEHLTAAVKAGKHVFCEKPVAVDAAGVRKVLDAAKMAKQKNLSLMSGFCWRYHEPKRASFNRILDGAVGDISAVYNTYDTGTLWSFPRQPGWTDAEYVLRNWTYYTWLAGDHIVEQAVHSIDMMAWAMGGKLPISAVGTGGRQVRTDELFGNVFDHFSIVYDYDNGVKGFHHSRQQANCENSYLVETIGSKGRAMVNCAKNHHEIYGQNPWKYDGANNDMYQTEHNELFAAIRSGNHVNDGEFMAHSTLTAIMGRMAAYTGKRISWDQALNSTEVLGPDTYSFQMAPPAIEVAKPGITAFS
ncbi:Gfo/Idh/MocA family protein [Dyadobacter tibetensis]|uniref:Gfo/Idh/MocA family protein n=1 Tax=Dyadobacter tibetensis TaxID=1211851 RepID=UPI00046EBF76|nr:Gfo/Idh/MocA family oxidoreductase [Dyadobacter tibetensis]